MRTPEFWCNHGLLAHLLEPFGYLYGVATSWRLARGQPWRASIPVICIGNLVAGGAGKTPVALAVAQYLIQQGLRPMFLTCGYGGNVYYPLQVIPERDRVDLVGDEALLLSAHAPTIVARHRAHGAQLAVAAGAQIIVMDDGYQDPTVYKDIALLVIDGDYGFGNSRLIPAGPLRESVTQGLARASALVIVDAGKMRSTGSSIHNLSSTLPVLKAHLTPVENAKRLAGQRVVAFAGIGRPGKFFATLQEIGAHLVACYPFADHSLYTEADIQPILEKALMLRAIPVTTAKDAVRLPHSQRKQVTVLTITLIWDDVPALEAILLPITQSVNNGINSSY